MSNRLAANLGTDQGDLSDPNCEALLGAPAGEELGHLRSNWTGIPWECSCADPIVHSYCQNQQEPPCATLRMLTKKESPPTLFSWNHMSYVAAAGSSISTSLQQTAQKKS